MLTVLNSKDRNRAFVKFIALFVITTVLIISAAYVDFRGLPESRKSFLEQKFRVQRIESLNQEEFVSHMEKARGLLDSMGRNPDQQTQLEILLTGKLNDMERSRQKDSSLYGKIDTRVLEAFMELQRMKKDRVALADMAGKAKALEQKLAQCEAALDTYRSRPQAAPAIQQ
jgi:type VI secretion system TssO-like protein